MNTFNKGKVKILVYKEKDADVWYATALEFNLTVDGEDKNAVLFELHQAILDYVISAKEINDDSVLNQEPDPLLLDLWKAHMDSQEIESPYTSYLAGVETLT